MKVTFYGKDAESSEHGCGTVDDDDDDGVSQHIGLHWDVGGHGNETPEPNRSREKHLLTSRLPHPETIKGVETRVDAY